MGEIGTVTAINDDNGMLTLNLKRGAACEGCKRCLAGLTETEMVMEAENRCGAKIGDRVEVELRDGYLLRASVIMYGGPLAGLVTGVLAGIYLFKGSDKAEALALVIGLACMAAAYLLIRAFDKKRGAYTPIAAAIREDKEDNEDS
ncbi:MAG: SoxR reducing system RseC family protein [Clostridiales bacterium]|jgi:sigma-E factor negative regulatory protein RseC|nr:SoxR reducing system RseC family protein [Clostridiales bacterium]